jgi:hypothetical protein
MFVIAASICSFVGCGYTRNSAAAAISMPAWQ